MKGSTRNQKGFSYGDKQKNRKHMVLVSTFITNSVANFSSCRRRQSNKSVGS